MNRLQSLLRHLGDARIVGGGVRNPLLGQPVDGEIDIASPLLPEVVMRIGLKLGYSVIPIKIDHGTVLLVKGKEKYEITTLRRDILTDGRWATVQYTRSWKQDAERRDFTINAISMDANNKLYDYVGGLKDIQNRILRFVGDPETRICEDYLRILRLFRFWAHYVQPSDRDINACISLKNGLQQISKERILAEMLKMYKAPNPWPAVKIMAMNDIIVHNILDESNGQLSALTRLALTIDTKTWPISKAQKHWINAIQIPAQNFGDILEAGYEHGYNFARDYALLYLPEVATKIPLSFAQFPLLPSELPVPPGPEMGIRYRDARKWWSRQIPSPNKEECLKWYIEKYGKD